MTYNNSLIYDFETLSQNQVKGVVVSVAILPFNMARVTHGKDYTYEELLDSCLVMKFDVKKQVTVYGREIELDTLNWWKEQTPQVRKQLDPSPDDKDISELYDFFILNTMVNNLQHVFTRNNTFDPMFLQYICSQFGKPLPYPWWLVRDTKSLINGMTWGQKIEDDFIPDGLASKFVKHDPKHDIAMDVMRLQSLSRILIPEDDIPF